MAPELIEILTQRLESFGIQLIEAAVALAPVEDEIGVFQNPQVLGNGRTTDRKPGRQFPNRKRAGKKTSQNRPAGSVAKSIELSFLVSSQLR